MAQYTKEQLQQFLDDNQEIFTLAKNAGVKPEQIPEDALNMSAFDASWGETVKSGLANAGRNLVKQGYGIARSVVEGVAEPEQEVEFMGKTYSPQQLGSSFGNVVRAVVGQEALEETASKLATADANVSENIAANTPFNSDPDSFKATSYNAISGVVPSLATGITAAVLTRNPMAAGAAVGGGAYGTYYGEGRDERDLTPEEARNRATTLAALEGVTSAIPFSKFLNTGGATGLQGMLSRVGGTALTEGAQEGFMTYAGAGYDKAIHDVALPEDLSTQAWRGFKAGALGGGVMGAGGYMMNPNPQVEQETNVNPDSVDLQQPEPQPNLDDPAYLRVKPKETTPIEPESEVVTEPVVDDNLEGIVQVEETTEPTTESEPVTDAESVVQTPVEDTPQVDEQPQPEQPKVEVDREQVYQNALKDFSEVAQQKNKSRQKELILAANKYLGTPKNPPKKGGKAALLNRIRETAKAHQSLQGATAESLKERFPTNKELIAFRKKHRIKTKATNKDALIKSILDWRDKAHNLANKKLDNNVVRNKVTQQYQNKEPVALSDFRQVRGNDYSLYQFGDVALTEAKGLKEIPPLEQQGEDYKLVRETSEILEDENNEIIAKLSDERLQHYVDRLEKVTNYDVLYLDAIKVMQELGYSKEVSRALGKMDYMDIADAIIEQAKKRGLNVPQRFYSELYDNDGNLIDPPSTTDEQKQSDTDKPQKYEAKDKAFYTSNNTTLDEVAAQYKSQKALEQAAFEAGKSNPNAFSPRILQETGFNHAVDIDSAGFDGDKVLAKVEEGQKAGGAKGLIASSPHRYHNTSLDEVAAKYKDQEALEKAAYEAGKSNPEKNLMTAFQETGFDSLRDVETAGFDHRKVTDAVKKGQAAAKNTKPEPTLEPLAEQDKSPALDDVIIQLSGKSSPAYLAARKLANNIKNMMYEGVSFNDAYNHFRKLNSSGISTFDRAYKNLTGRTPTQALLDPRKEKSLDQIKTVGDAIFNIKSGRDMAHWLSKHATSPVTRRIAERIAPLISADLKIKSIGYRKGNKPPAGMGNKQGWYIYERFESGKVDERILLWNEGEKRASTEEVVTHELIHAATSLAIANAKKADPKSEIAKVVKELDAIRKEAFEHYVNRKAKRQLTATEKSKEGKFAISKGLNNENSESAIDEFVAWGLTNPELQDILKGIKLKPKKSAWSEFVNAIGKLLGLKPTDNTALGRLLETTDKLLTLTEAEQAAQTRSLGHDVNVGTPVTQQEINDFRHKLDPDSAKLPLKDKIVQESKALAEKGFGTATSNVLSKMRQGIVDKYEPLRKLDEALHGDNILSNTLSRAWVLAKSANAAQGALHAMLEYGRIRYNRGQKIIETVSDKNSGGLKKVLSQLDEKNELEDFFYWIAANRANDINERSMAAEAEIRNLKAEKKLLLEMRHEADSRLTRNKIEKAIKDTDSKLKELQKVADVKERFMSERDIEIGMSLNQLNRKDGTSREALFDKVHKEFNVYRADVLKIAEATGVISGENRAMWEDQFYVPFYRVLGDSEQSGPHPSIGLSRQDVIKKLKGSEKQLGNLLDNTLMNFHYLLNASLKNRAAFQALENAERMGGARKVSEHKRDKDTSTYVMIDGKKQWYDVDDPSYLGALMSMSSMQLPDGFRQVAQAGSGVKVFFTKWTTAAPDFIVKNFIRDAILAPALSNVGWKDGGTLRGAKLWGIGEMSRIQADMLASGGAFEFGFNRDEVKNTLSADMKKKVVSAEDALGMFGKALNSYKQVQNLAENANRAAIYAANLDKGKLVASFEAMDLMDFGAGGSWAGIRLLNSVVPFMNATLQGLDKTARAGGTVWQTARGQASQETRAQAIKFATYTASLAVATIGMALQNADDEEYQQLPDYAKNMYWFIRTGGEKGQYILVAKPQGIGFPLNVAERMTDAFTGVIKTKDTLDYVKTTLFNTLMLNPTPQVAKPIAELYMNRNMFTGQAIESARDERFSKSERFDYRTSEIAKLLGNDAISPKQIDHLIQGYFSTGGAILSELINVSVDQFTENDRPQGHWHEQRWNPARALFKDLSSPRFTRSQQYFYDIYSEFSQAKNDYKRAVEMGDKAKAGEILDKGKVKIRLVPMLDKYKRKVSQINKRIDAVRSDKRLSAEEKRNYIDAYNKLKAQTFKKVTERVDAVLAKYE